MPRKCLLMMSCQVLHSMSLEVSTGVYIVHGDAPEGAVLEEKFFGDRRPKFAFWGPECTNIWKTILSNFGAGFFYLRAVSPERPLCYGIEWNEVDL